MNNVFYSVLPILLIAVLGSVIRRKWLTSDEFWRGLEKLSYYLLFPTVLFDHCASIDLKSSEFLRLTSSLVIANVLVIAILVFYQIRTDFDKIKFTSVFQGATRYNNYIFFAIGSALFGSTGVTIIAAISPYMLILTNVSAITAFYYYLPKEGNLTGRKSFIIVGQSIIANPFIISSLLGFLVNYSGINLNLGIKNTIQIISDSAFAIGMLIVGAGMKFKIDPTHYKMITITSIIKLILTPIITYIALWILSVNGTAKSVGILFSCLPCASSSYILSRQLGGDHETMSSIITSTTLLSILSLSLLVYILG